MVVAETAPSKKPYRYVNLLESETRDGDSPVADDGRARRHHPSTPGHEKPWGTLGGPPSKAKHSWPPIAN